MKYFLFIVLIAATGCNNLHQERPEDNTHKAYYISKIDSLQKLLDSCRSRPMLQSTTGDNSPAVISNNPVKIEY